MSKNIRVLALCALATAIALPETAYATLAGNAAADVVSVRGKGEVRQRTAGWRKAIVDLDLFTGDNVRTGSFSGMGLLFRDRTQIRLGERSFLRVKAVGSAPASGNTVLRLDRGRAWAQTKRVGGTLLMETPAATAAIRGTDWDLRVGAGGVTTITVLSGSVRFYNPYGSVTVNRNEAARAVPGQAPVKMIVVNPSDRVQWVTAYQAEPDRHIRVAARGGKEDSRLRLIAKLIENQNYATALARLRAMTASGAGGVGAPLMLSDLLMSLGDVEQAVKVAERTVRRYPKEPAARAHLARLYMITNQSAKARTELDKALTDDPENREALLIQGQLARLDGDGKEARQAFLMGLNADQRDDRFWYWMGVVETEREDVYPARDYLGKAVDLNPDGLGYKGERGTLETFADNFKMAARNYDEALKTNPDDFVALTGRGLMKLKRGKTQEALDDFLAASLMEPRYARAHMYLGVAYYQLGMVEFALSALEMASAMDAKDPMPHMLATMIKVDEYRGGEAVREAQTAQRKMPYLKSLNQIANDSRGTANLGRSYAFFGLSEWADSAAQQSYHPYWAGSHMFLADRYIDTFNKNSEMFQGLLADPTIFGASLTRQTLFQKPGIHGQVSHTQRGREDNPRWEVDQIAQARLFDNSVVPFAAFAHRERLEFNDKSVTGLTSFADEGDLVSAAIGIKPFYGLGLFGYFNSEEIDRITGPGNTFVLDQDVQKVDLGGSYKFSPTNQLSVKLSRNETSNQAVTLFNTFYGPGDWTVDNSFDQDEAALRHTFDLGDHHEISWGAEYVDRRGYEQSVTTSPTVDFFTFNVVPSYLHGNTTTENQYKDFYVSDRVKVTPNLLIQADLHFVDFERTALANIWYEVPSSNYILPYNLPPEDASVSKIFPRIGLSYKFGENRVFRLAYQNWIRPPSTATLSPVATAGIPLDNLWLDHGGEAERLRAQLEWQWTPNLFTKIFAEHRRIDNYVYGYRVAYPPGDERLRALSNVKDLSFVTNEYWVNAIAFQPLVEDGEATRFGIGANYIVNDNLSVFGRYQFTDSEVTSFYGYGSVYPYHPRHQVTVGGTWMTSYNTYLTGKLTYKTEELLNNYSQVLDPEFDGSVRFYWESDNKNVIFNVGVDNLFVRNTDPLFAGELVLRF